MGSPYQSQSASGYNSSPPPDDGSTVAANKITWATIKSKITDPLKTLADAINTALRTALDVSASTTSVNYTTQVSDHLKPIECTGSITISLGDAATMVAQTVGYQVPVYNKGSGTVTITVATGTDTLNGTAAGKMILRANEGAIFNVAQAGAGYFATVISQRVIGTIASGRNIAARTNSGTPNTKLDITADEISLRDTGGNIFVAQTVSVTIDFGATGANGLDSGSQASSTWYYGWVIAKPDGTVAGLGSTSSSGPTMPSGYTFKALVTAAKSDGSTHFVKYRQFGNEVFFEQAVSALNTSSYPTTETALDISPEIPPIAKSVKINTYGSVVASGGAVSTNLTLRVVTSVDLQVIYCKTSATAQTSAFSVVSDLPNIGQNIYYLWANVTNAAADAYKIDVLGFKLPGGGE